MGARRRKHRGVLAVVPARGGSQHVPNKSTQAIAGRPAVAYTIDECVRSETIDRYVVSTEDGRIAAVARSFDAPVIDRPPELATPTARLDGVLQHAVDEVERQSGWRPGYVVMLYSSVVLRPAGFVDECVRLLVTSGADSVRSVAPVDDHHPAWMVRVEQGRLVPFMEMNAYRRQDLPPLFLYTGACVCMTYEALFNPDADRGDNFYYFGHDQRAAVHEPEQCVEIHEWRDVAWAEFLLAERQRRQSAAHPRRRPA